MRYRLQVSPLLPLALLLLVVVGGLPMIPAVPAPSNRDGWATRIADMDRALGGDDAPGAQAAWREAYVTAHVTHAWPGMIAVGDAALRLGQVAGASEVGQARARRAYLTALLRARRQGSLDGVLAAGEAFARLGDGQVVRQVLAIASDLAARSGDDGARLRVQGFRNQWVARPLG